WGNAARTSRCNRIEGICGLSLANPGGGLLVACLPASTRRRFSSPRLFRWDRTRSQAAAYLDRRSGLAIPFCDGRHTEICFAGNSNHAYWTERELAPQSEGSLPPIVRKKGSGPA